MGHPKKLGITSINFGEKGQVSREIFEQLKVKNVDISKYVRKLLLNDNLNQPIFLEAKKKMMINEFQELSEEIRSKARKKTKLAEKLLKNYNFDVINLI